MSGGVDGGDAQPMARAGNQIQHLDFRFGDGFVALSVETNVYVVVPGFEPTANVEKFDLAEMVSRMPADYQASEENFGEPVGKEEW